MLRKFVMPPKSDGVIEAVRFEFSEETRSQRTKSFDQLDGVRLGLRSEASLLQQSNS